MVILAALALGGCFGGRLSPEGPPGVDLGGTWRLNRAASDDPQQVIARLHAEIAQRMRRLITAEGAGPAVPASARGSAAAAQTAREQQAEALALSRPRGDPLAGSPTLAALNARAAQGDLLLIRQQPGEIVFDFGSTRRSFVPGQHSVVSAPLGVADQSSGWRERAFVVRIVPQLGPALTDTYTPSRDGRQLTEKLHIDAADLVPAVDLTRIFDASGEAGTRAVPDNR